MRSRWAVASVLVLAAAAALIIALSEGTSPPARVLDFGADLGVIFQSHRPPRVVNRALASAEDAGLGLARVAPLWEFTEPRAPEQGRHHYDWRYDDYIASQLASHGFRWVAVLAFAPGWASVAPAILHAAPRGTSNYAAYAAAVAGRYRGRIAAFEIWNEENTRAFWRPTPNPVAYARLYAAARIAIHRADPGVPVLVGGLAGGHRRFFHQLLGQPELRGAIDGIALHAYAPTPAGVLSQVAAYRSMLEHQGFPTVPLYVTEYGWSSRRVLAPGVAPGSYVPSPRRASFIVQAAHDVLESGCNVRMAIFYAWLTQQQDPSALYQWYGVAAPSGSLAPASRALAAAPQSLPQQSAPAGSSCPPP